MTDISGGSLNAAYEAIKAKDLAKARDVLSAYLLDNPNDADAWWLYSYAVTEPEDGRKALQTVLRLDPAYPGARDLLEELENASPTPTPAEIPAPPAGIKPITSLPQRATATTTVAPEDDLDPEFGFADEEEPQGGGFKRLLIAALAAAVVLAIVAAVFILPNLNRDQGGTAVPSQTAVAADPTADIVTSEPTQESAMSATDVLVDVTPTDAGSVDAATEAPAVETAVVEQPTESAPVPTSEAASPAALQPAYDALATYSVVPESATTEATSLGQTTSISVCAVSSELRSIIPGVLTALAAVSPQLPQDVQAVGARIVNCTTNEPLRFVAISMEDALAYASGSITDADLRQRFTPLP